MLRDSVEGRDVLSNELGCAMVVVKDGEDAVGDGVVGVSCADVDGEDGVDGEEDEHVELCKEEGADWGGFGRFAAPVRARWGEGSTRGWGSGEVGF